MTCAMSKHRLDQLVVERGLAESRERAQALILAGQVIVNGQKSSKPGHSIADDARIEVLERMPYVSRGGFKLAAALDHFSIDVSGWTCLDVGASTGGFTDCLLQRGAKNVWAIDVGHGQFDWKLRNDPRVVVQEGINARYLEPANYPVKFDLAACDASFISATMLIPAIVPLLASPHRLIVLVKPQFEVGRAEIGKGGIVRSAELHELACARIRNAVQAQGLDSAIIPSPILGTEGNREFLLYGHD
jgi:23S rRNA (cytidine1920-2'-O)/16S rRNA (cytidine1409-2'-O)-methyltransferase